jgi:Family of unknown function (DUF6338)
VFTTLVAVVSVLVLVLPGFVIVDLQRRKRASVAASDLAYGVVVLAVAPVVLGLALNELLLHGERSGRLRWWHYALGGRDARQAWDYLFQRLDTGRWVVIKLKTARAIAGKLGNGSWVSQTPAPDGHDLWLQEIWTVDDAGRPAVMVEPQQGMWIARDDIEALFVIDPPAA